MIDVGDNAVPAFMDEDGDGDMDLFIGNNVGANISASIYYFQNTGTDTHPAFVLMTDDYAGISALRLYNLKPQFADLDADGKWDLVFTATNLQTNLTSLRFIPNGSASKLDLSGQPVIATNFFINQPENILVVDINRDGLNDVLVGRSTGSLEYWTNNGPRGALNLALQDGSFLGMIVSTSRQSLSIAAGDLDSDGKADLLLGDQRGKLSIFKDFLGEAIPATGPEDVLFFNSLTENPNPTELGGRIWPAIANLFNTNRPVIAVGNTLGGIHILKSDGTKELPTDPAIDIYPNPIARGNGFFVKTDRNVMVQFVSVLGQKLSDEFLIPGNQPYPITTQGLTSGMYIARFSVKGKTYIRKFIIY